MHLESILNRQINSSTTTSTIDWDIGDGNLPQIMETNEFEMWPDGNRKLAYDFAKNERVRRHQSGWAMRNTNNHNRDILKKSCLGVLLCEDNCLNAETRQCVTLRPAICDKARKKQLVNKCPNCGGNLVLQSCKGNSGYPVTHYWRKDLDKIFFQSKGVHDHLRPDIRPHRENRKRSSESSLMYRENNFFLPSSDSGDILKSYCTPCFQENCACQKNIKHLRNQILMSRKPDEMFWNSIPYQYHLNSPANYYRLPNYFSNPHQANCFYQQNPFIPSTFAHPSVIPSTLPFLKEEPEESSIPKPFTLGSAQVYRDFNQYPAILSSNLSVGKINSADYSNILSSATCRYPFPEAITSNIQTNFSMANCKY